MKVFILLECEAYNGGGRIISTTKILDVYCSFKAGYTALHRLDHLTNKTYHLIKKSVKGLAGIKFEIDGKKRFLTGTIKNEV